MFTVDPSLVDLLSPEYKGDCNAWLISSSASFIALFTPVIMTFFPAKRFKSTCLSQATTMASALSISSAVGIFFTPTEPLVSTLHS